MDRRYTKKTKRTSTSRKNKSNFSRRINIIAMALIFAGIGFAGVRYLMKGHAAAAIPEIRLECGIDHYGPDDPIVFPGVPGASHMHSFYSNKSTDAYSTTATLMANISSCGYTGNFDRSAYWIPSLYYTNPDGTTTRFSSSSQEMIVYYRRFGGANGPLVHTIPNGLKMIAGDAKATTPQQYAITYWDCNGGPQYAYIPNCAGQSSGTTPRAVLNFPSCWDGVHLDSADHKSHMAYPDPKTFACPADHPVVLPAISFEVSMNGTSGGSNYFLSSGGVYSFHGDFVSAWDTRLLNGLIDKCMNTTITECHVVTIDNSGNVAHNGTYLFNLSQYSATPTTGDLNNDGTVGLVDLSILLSKWGTSDATADLDKSGTVSVADLSILLSHWST